MFGAMFGGFLLMMGRFQMMAVRDMRVVMALGVIAVLMGFRCFLMMSSCLFVMVGSLGVVVGKFLARHSYALDVANLRQPIDAVLSSRLRVHAEPFVGSSSVDLYRTAISGRASSRER